MACRHWLTSHLGYCFSRNEKLRKNCVEIPDGGDDYDDDGDERLWENFDKIPFKRLALQVFTKLFARLNVSKVPNVFSNSVIVVLLVVVKPYLTTATRFQTRFRVQTPLSSKCRGMWRNPCFRHVIGSIYHYHQNVEECEGERVATSASRTEFLWTIFPFPSHLYGDLFLNIGKWRIGNKGKNMI